MKAVLEKHDAFTSIYYGMRQHSPIADIKDGLRQFKESGAEVIVAVGGGSPIDASKAMLYNLHKETGKPILHQIAIPTTLSAAEYTVSDSFRHPHTSRTHIEFTAWQIYAGFTNEEGKKVGVGLQEMVPAGIILDAELTLGTPQRLW